MRRLLLLAVLSCTILAAAEENGGNEPSPLWKWANFAILAVGLGYLIGKFAPPLLRARNQEIQKGISEAQQVKRDAEQRAAQMHARLNAIGADIERFRTQAAAEMQQEGERIRQDTAAQIKRVEQQAEQELESAGKTALRELKEYAADLALGLAEQRLRARLDSAADSALVDKFMGDLTRQESKN